MAGRTIIRGADIVTMDAALGDLPASDILIENGLIAAIGPSLQALDAERIEASGMIALPGIIDAHTCLWQTVLRGYVPDLWSGAYYAKLTARPASLLGASALRTLRTPARLVGPPRQLNSRR